MLYARSLAHGSRAHTHVSSWASHPRTSRIILSNSSTRKSQKLFQWQTRRRWWSRAGGGPSSSRGRCSSAPCGPAGPSATIFGWRLEALRPTCMSACACGSCAALSSSVPGIRQRLVAAAVRLGGAPRAQTPISTEDSAQASSGAACGRFGGRGRRASVVCSLTMARMKVRDRLERAGVTQGGIVGVSRENHTAHARDQQKAEEQTRTSNVTKTGRKLGTDATRPAVAAAHGSSRATTGTSRLSR